MNKKISLLLDKIRKTADKYNQKLQPPATEEQIDSLVERAEKMFGEELPEVYLDLLREANGFLWDNLYIYASEPVPHAGTSRWPVEGIIEANEECRETLPDLFNDLIIFGYSGNLDYYAKEVSSGEFQILDKGSLSLTKSFKTLDELLVEVITPRA